MKVAVFPGSFDPITIGHQDIVERGSVLFDKVIVAIGVNSRKKYLFDLEDRVQWLKEVFAENPKVEVTTYEGLTIDFCKEQSAEFLLRGIRTAADFDYEKTIAHLNNAMLPGLETILILSKPEYSSISSTIVREIILGKGNADMFLPKQIANKVKV